MPASTASTDLTCLQCGTVASRAGALLCRRCGVRFGEAPPPFARLATCPLCYRTTDDDGRFASQAQPGRRLDINAHIDEHDCFPVGDDDWLETLRVHDRIRIGRWDAPFDQVRRYLVTGALDGGRNRLAQHNAIVMAMAQIARWGHQAQVLGDTHEWREAREAVTALMERFHRGGTGLRA